MHDKPLDEDILCFLRVTMRRAEVSKASNHRDGPRLHCVQDGNLCLVQELSIGWFYERRGLDRAVFDPHFAIKDPMLSWLMF